MNWRIAFKTQSDMDEHNDRCAEYAQIIGIDLLRKIVERITTKEEIETLLAEGDTHLNKIPLYRWDGIAYNTRMFGLCLSMRVSILKYVAKFHM